MTNTPQNLIAEPISYAEGSSFRKWRWFTFGLLGACLLSLGWGYLRLPWAAIQTIGSFKLLYPGQPITFHGNIGVSSIQDLYLLNSLKTAVTQSPTGFIPIELPKVSASVKVKRNALVLARVEVHYDSPGSHEMDDSLYFCLFGAWIRTHRYNSFIACGFSRATEKR